MFFFKSSDPYQDICVISLAPSVLKSESSRLAKKLKRIFCSVGLDVYFASDKLLVVGSEVSPGETALSGYSYGGDADVSNRVGEFTYFSFVSEDEVCAGTDYFGLGVLYTYQCEYFSAVTNRLHILASAIPQLDPDCQFDERLLNGMAYMEAPFLSQPISDDLYIKNGKRVPVGCEVVLSNGTASWKKKGISADRRRVKAGEERRGYDELLSLGVAEVVSNVKEISRLHDGGLVVDLSGGKDSRMVLAAAMEALGKDKIKIFSKDVVGTKDLDIACLIASKFGLSFYSDFSGDLMSLCPEEFLSGWRSYYWGEYHRIGFPVLTAMGGAPLLHLSGGCGEVVSSTAKVEWLRKLGVKLDGLSKKAVQKYCKVATELNVLSKLEAASVCEMWNEWEKDEEFSDLDDALNWFYLKYRNRVHFGFNQLSRAHGEFTVFPLMSRNLYLASLKLSEQQRLEGKLVYDVISSLNPRLALLPYDSEFPFVQRLEGFLSYGQAMKESCEAFKEKKAEWYASQEKLRVSRVKSIKSRPKYKYEASDDVVMRLAVKSLDRLLYESEKKSEDYWLFLYEKLLSLYFSEKKLSALPFAMSLIGLADYHRASDVFTENIPAVFPLLEDPISHVEVRRENSNVKVKVEFRADVWGEIAECAIYVYREKKIVDRVWYKRKLEFDIALDDRSEVGVMVFLRIPGRSVISKKYVDIPAG